MLKKRLKNNILTLNKKRLIAIVAVIIFIIIDQVTKILLAKDIMVIEGVLKFSEVHNTGMAFGLFGSSTWFISILNILLIGFMIRFLIKFNDRSSNLMKVSLLLIIAGGIGNLIDRIFRGNVIDFIDFSQIINFPVFNLADIAIVIGWFVLVLAFIKDIKK